jgi:hypothetical protein
MSVKSGALSPTSTDITSSQWHGQADQLCVVVLAKPPRSSCPASESTGGHSSA